MASQNYYNQQELTMFAQILAPYFKSFPAYIPQFMNVGRKMGMFKPFTDIKANVDSVDFSQDNAIIDTMTTEFASAYAKMESLDAKICRAVWTFKMTGQEKAILGDAAMRSASRIVYALWSIYDKGIFTGFGKIQKGLNEMTKQVPAGNYPDTAVTYTTAVTDLINDMEEQMGTGGYYVVVIPSNWAQKYQNVYSLSPLAYLMENLICPTASAKPELRISPILKELGIVNPQIYRVDMNQEFSGLPPTVLDAVEGSSVITPSQIAYGFDGVAHALEASEAYQALVYTGGSAIPTVA